ncbi:ATP-binding protein [Herpetosiphon gulosus]|uniref:AAA+ ATPase domain-containing protein n=1 Tax=Herpetosiphon gulosus TaxID=1973496 RepID=A0ABP9X7Q8_9CHLR
MSKPDLRGARASNAGDTFHELWVLRHALSLLNEDTNLAAITVEGLMVDDEIGTSKDQWDGVDCAFYYGGDSIESADRIVVDQLKYSTSNAQQPWTVNRLTYASNDKKDNSVIGRLAKIFSGLKKKRSDFIAGKHITLRLVSNQPLDPAVWAMLLGQPTPPRRGKKQTAPVTDRDRFVKASGLDSNTFEDFIKSLDFSLCGIQSRFALEKHIHATISTWIDDDARTSVNNLLRFVQSAMLPEGRRDYITRQSILAGLGFSDPRTIFPCPSEIKQLDHLVLRAAAQTIVEMLISNKQRLCVHGEGGMGKTTLLQDIKARLPDDSVMIVFDCYGGGRYLDADAFRHRAQDAFLQLSNDLAREIRIPLLLNRSTAHDYPRAFKKRLERAADVIAANNPSALVLIVVDAADNALTAALTQGDKCFISDFLSIGTLPSNVRLLVSARTGRLPMLELPYTFDKFELSGFTLDETAHHVHSVWPEAPDAWIEDFHKLSRGIPRVQRYAFDIAQDKPDKALRYLLPHGKDLDHVFEQQFTQAILKIGQQQELLMFCSALIALPRPIPLSDLAAVTKFNETHIRDLASDLAPGVQVVNNLISFADEDFEQFVRLKAEARLHMLQLKIAEHFTKQAQQDSYAATHLASALLAAGRKQDIIMLVDKEPIPEAIRDPLLRRDTQLQRLRIAMKVCREAENPVDSLLTLLKGAEALKTNVTIHNSIINNLDLVAIFAPHTYALAVLRNSQEIQHHGPLLFHMMANDALEKNAFAVRNGYRQIRAWLQRRNSEFVLKKQRFPNDEPEGWEIGTNDIVAETEALLRIEGPQSAIAQLLRWRPRSAVFEVALRLSKKLITSGDIDLLQQVLQEIPRQTPWDIFLLVPLVLVGQSSDIARIETCLGILYRRGLIKADKLKERARNEDFSYIEYIDLILTACEIVVGHTTQHKNALSILQSFVTPERRCYDEFNTSDSFYIDIILRAYSLLRRLGGQEIEIREFLVEPSIKLSTETTRRQNAQLREKKDQLSEFLLPLIPVYTVRAQLIIGQISGEAGTLLLQKAVNRTGMNTYKFDASYHAFGMRTQVASSITKLLMVSEFDRIALLKSIKAVVGWKNDYLSETMVKMYTHLAMDHSFHETILSAVTDQSKSIKSMRIETQDKIDAFLRFARLIMPFSHADAKPFFFNALEIANDINLETGREIALFNPLVKHGFHVLSPEQRCEMASQLAIVVSDTHTRIGNSDEFPWTEVTEAITTLDCSVAFAMAGRWDDINIIKYENILPTILLTALLQNTIAPESATACATLLDNFPSKLMSSIIEGSSSKNRNLIIEILACDELLRFGHGQRSEVVTVLKAENPSTFWLKQLMKAELFHQQEVAQKPDDKSLDIFDMVDNQKKITPPDPFQGIDWDQRFVSKDTINAVLEQVIETARRIDSFIYPEKILNHIATVVSFRDRVAYLDVLSEGGLYGIHNIMLADAIVYCIKEWNTPAVIDWCKTSLMDVIGKMLPEFAAYLTYGHSPLPMLLTKTGLPAHEIFNGLLAAIERHVDTLQSLTIFALVGLLGEYSSPWVAADVSGRYASRLVDRIPAQDCDRWDLVDIPSSGSEALARFLYALMSDIDVYKRWRAAHTVRRLARLQESETVDHIVSLYHKKTELSYRNPHAPFYWLAARLWLVITLDRIATETPNIAALYGEKLFGIASDTSFPHLLIRAFAKSAVLHLDETGTLLLDAQQRTLLDNITIGVSTTLRESQRHIHQTDLYQNQPSRSERFSFDSIDTIPYWYSPAIKLFFDVGMTEFCTIAEEWIVDTWQVHDNPREWSKEPRNYRITDSMGMSTMHRHGDLPRIERYHTYLEWHAMWCTMGQLIQTRSLANNSDEDDDYYTPDGWIRRNGLAMPPFWLADFLRAKPLEAQFWISPEVPIDAWVDSITDQTFLNQIFASDNSEMLVVDGDHNTHSYRFKQETRIRTALVSPDTALALARALQTVADSWDYRIPYVEDRLAIDTSPYKLIGWLIDYEHLIEGIDEYDPLCYDIRSIETYPGPMVESVLNLKFHYGDQLQWVNVEDSSTAFIYECWGDSRDDRTEYTMRSTAQVQSNGWRLNINKKALLAFLDEVQLDLIVEVKITRENNGYGRDRDDESRTKKNQPHRIFILRRDGTIDAAERCIGTWTVSRS